MPKTDMKNLAKVATEHIRRNGYYIQAVLPSTEGHPAYYYTIGLSFAREKRYPELVMAGWIEPEQIAGFLHAAVSAMEAGRMVPTAAGYYGGVFENLDVGVLPIRPGDGDSAVLVPRDAEVFLVVIPDPNGLFPWEAGCDRDYADQIKGFDIVAFPPSRPAATVH